MKKKIISISIIFSIFLAAAALFYLYQFGILKIGADTYAPATWTQSYFSRETQSSYTINWGQSSSWNGFADLKDMWMVRNDYFRVGSRAGIFTTSIYTGSNETAIETMTISGGKISSVQYRGASSLSGIYNASYLSEAEFKNKCLSDRRYVQAKITFSSDQNISDLNITVRQGTRNLNGTITNKTTGKAVSGVLVKAGNFNVSSDNNGRYSLNLPFQKDSSSFTVAYTKSGFNEQSKSISDVCGKALTQNIALQPISSPPPPRPAPTADIKLNGVDYPGALDYNSTVKINWNSTNTDSCTASGGWSGAKGTSGEETSGNLTGRTDFTITCVGNGSASDSSTVEINSPPPPDDEPEDNQDEGSDANQDNQTPLDEQAPDETPQDSPPSEEQPIMPDETETPTDNTAGGTDDQVSDKDNAEATPETTDQGSATANAWVYLTLIGITLLGGGIYFFVKYRSSQITGEDLLKETTQNDDVVSKTIAAVENEGEIVRSAAALPKQVPATNLSSTQPSVPPPPASKDIPQPEVVPNKPGPLPSSVPAANLGSENTDDLDID